MSKMDALRAMREARYAETTAKAAGRARPAAAPVAPPAARAKPAVVATEASTPAPAAAGDPGLCGHRNMGGRTCTREHGHSAKSHRYS